MSGTISSIQVLACNVEITPLGKSVGVFTSTFPIEIDNQQWPEDEAAWTNWSLPNASTDPSLVSVSSIVLHCVICKKKPLHIHCRLESWRNSLLLVTQHATLRFRERMYQATIH